MTQDQAIQAAEAAVRTTDWPANVHVHAGYFVASPAHWFVHFIRTLEDGGGTLAHAIVSEAGDVWVKV